MKKKFGKTLLLALVLCLVWTLAITPAGAEEAPAGAGDALAEGTLYTDEASVTLPTATEIDELAALGLVDADTVLVVREGAEDDVDVTQPREGESLGAAVERLRAEGGVLIAQPNYHYYALATPNDPGYPRQWGMQPSSATNVPSAWASLPVPAQKVRVAVLDTGVDLTHPDLAGVIETASAFNTITGSADVTDTEGHGTHVAGIIAAVTNNGIGVAGVAGGYATIVPIKVFSGSGETSTSEIRKGLTRAESLGCRVINLSLGGYGGYDEVFAQQVARLSKGGAAVVCAGGNGDPQGYPTTKSCYPSDFPEAISVTATDAANGHAYYSDYNQYKDVAAPGGVDALGIYSTLPGGTYGEKCGTSMAAPFVSGVAALMLAANSDLDGASVRAALEATATDLGTPGRDNYFGYGLVNAGAAVAYVQQAVTVTWDAQGGSAVPAQALRFGGRVGFLPETSRAGYSFQGWYTAPSGGEKIDAEARASGNVIFYARWKAKSYKVKFDANGGQLDGSASKKVKMGASYKAPKAARGGYVFVGWFTKKSGGTKVSSKLAIAKNHTLYAHWTTIDKTVRFSANGGKAVKSSKNVKFGKKYGKLPKTTRKGYTFEGWYTSKDGGSKVTKSSKVKSEKSSFKLYAHWTPKTYTVTWDAAGGSVGVVYPDGTVVAAPSVALPETYDAVYAMPADPVLAGCTFAGWWTKASGGKQILPGATVKITKNTTIYAHWNVV